MSLRPTARIAVGALVCCFALHGQLPDEAKKAAETWLLTNCGEDDAVRIESVLEKYKTQMEAVFIDALQNGPDSRRLDTVRRAAADRFQQIQKTLQARESRVSDADRKQWNAITAEQYVAQQTEDFKLRYRSQAAAGLGIVDGESGRAALRTFAQDRASPLQSSAQAALLRLGEPSSKAAYQKK